jgi:hypothetical protein
MKTLKVFLVLFLAGAIFAPDAAFAARMLGKDHRCGKVICCCPDMCRKMKQEATCHSAAPIKCGLQQARSGPRSLVPDWVAPVRIALLPSFQLDRSRLSALFREPFARLRSNPQSPLDKPPTAVL